MTTAPAQVTEEASSPSNMTAAMPEPAATPVAPTNAAAVAEPTAAPVVAPTEPTITQTQASTAEPVEVVEPQNPLTEKFTDREWTALKEFRVSQVVVLLTPVSDIQTSQPFQTY